MNFFIDFKFIKTGASDNRIINKGAIGRRTHGVG